MAVAVRARLSGELHELVASFVATIDDDDNVAIDASIINNNNRVVVNVVGPSPIVVHIPQGVSGVGERRVAVRDRVLLSALSHLARLGERRAGSRRRQTLRQGHPGRDAQALRVVQLHRGLVSPADHVAAQELRRASHDHHHNNKWWRRWSTSVGLVHVS